MSQSRKPKAITGREAFEFKVGERSTPETVSSVKRNDPSTYPYPAMEPGHRENFYIVNQSLYEKTSIFSGHGIYTRTMFAVNWALQPNDAPHNPHQFGNTCMSAAMRKATETNMDDISKGQGRASDFYRREQAALLNDQKAAEAAGEHELARINRFGVAATRAGATFFTGMEGVYDGVSSVSVENALTIKLGTRRE
jgi:hypothetical protein